MLIYDIQEYIDADGLVTPRKCLPTDRGITGNGVLYTAELVALLAKRGELSPQYRQAWIDVMRKCQIVPGLITRSPVKMDDQEGPDDYVGYAVGAYICNPAMAQEVIDYGWKNKGFFNNEVPGTIRRKDGKINWSAFLIRQLQLIALFYYAAGKKPCMFLRMFSAVTIAISGLGVGVEHSDPRFLTWMRIQVVGDKDWMHRLATKIWMRRLKKQYANGMKDVAERYFEPGHPFATYFVD